MLAMGCAAALIATPRRRHRFLSHPLAPDWLNRSTPRPTETPAEKFHETSFIIPDDINLRFIRFVNTTAAATESAHHYSRRIFPCLSLSPIRAIPSLPWP